MFSIHTARVTGIFDWPYFYRVFLLSALEEFTAQVEKYEQGKSKYDIIEAYCRGSPECNEIFNLLEAGKRKTSEVRIVLQLVMA